MNAPATSNFTALAILMLIAGMGIPIMAALNANVGQHIPSPVAASAILFALGFVVTAVVLAFVGLPSMQSFRGVSPWDFSAAFLVAFYLLSITFTAPKIGVGNAVFFVLLGQLGAAAVIDHFGLFGAIQTALTWRRATGIAVMALGVWLAKKQA